MGGAREADDAPMTAWRWLPVALALAGCGDNTEERGKELVSREFLDPSSAQFRDLKVGRVENGNALPNFQATSGGKVLCGDVNAKNRLGGYVGFRPFIVDINSGRVELAPQVEPGMMEIEKTTVGFQRISFDVARSIFCGIPHTVQVPGQPPG